MPENGVDAMELLSYLDTPEQSGPNSALNSTGVTNSTISSNSSSMNDDLLSLFDT